MGSSGYAGALSLQNLKNLFDDDAATVGKSPNLQFTLDTVPTGSGNATIKVTIIDGSDGTRTGTENEISVEVDVTYLGDGTTATITAAAGGTATGSYTKGDGTSVSFTVDNGDVDAFGFTAGNARTGTQATLDVALETIYDAFITGAGRAELLAEGNYSIAVETTLPMQNYADATVTKFTGSVNLYDGAGKNLIVGTDGADTITGTAGAEVIITGAGKDTISTGGGADYIIIGAGQGSTTLANANTVAGHLTEPTSGTSGFTNGVDKFALSGDLTFADLTVAGANSNADTNVSITATGEYLMTIVGLSPGYVLTDDFVDVDAIV
jgi:Ca2+-binding RTX toxin-like protein